MTLLRTAALLAATLTTGLVSGVFYAYSTSVMLGLAARPDADFVFTMQEINDRIQNPIFFASFMGAVLFLLVALVFHLPVRRSGRFRLITLACLLYIGGAFLLTVFVNVPLNDALANVPADASSEELTAARTAFESSWNFWNDVRGVLSTLAFVALIGACLTRDHSSRKTRVRGTETRSSLMDRNRQAASRATIKLYSDERSTRCVSVLRAFLRRILRPASR